MRVGSKRLRFQRHGRRKFVVFIIILCAIAAGLVWLFWKGPLSAQKTDVPTPSAQPTVSASPTPETSPPAAQSASPAAGTETGVAGGGQATPMPSGTVEIGTGGAVLVGNSNLEDLYIYGQVPEAEYYYKVGLTVEDAFTTATDQGTVPIVEELAGKNYDRVFLMFGHNELGWDNRQQFFDKYKELIDRIRQENPNARIYVMGVLPVTKATSDQAADGVTQQAIDQMNSELRTFANENNCYFMDLGAALKDNDGYLPADAAADGVHLNQEYSAIWAEILRNEIGGEMG